MNSKTKIDMWYIIAAFVALSLLYGFYQASKQYTVIPYGQFQSLLDANKIDKVWVAQNNIRGVLKQPEKNGIRQFETTGVDPDWQARSISTRSPISERRRAPGCQTFFLR
jgi:cell division protease FtsH